MPNKNYRKGSSYEREIVERFNENPMQIAFRTAGSHSPFDVIAIDFSSHEIILIQAKRTRHGLTLNERIKLLESIQNKLAVKQIVSDSSGLFGIFKLKIQLRNKGDREEEAIF